MSGLDGSYWNTIDVNSPRLRRRASTPTSFSSYAPPSPPRHVKRHPLKPLLKNKKPKDLSSGNVLSSPLKVVKEEILLKKEEELPSSTNDDNASTVTQSWDQEKEVSVTVQVKEEAKEDAVTVEDDGNTNILNDTKIENDEGSSNNNDDYDEPFFDDISITSAIDAASVDDDDNGFYDEFSYNEDSNFGNEDFNFESSSSTVPNQIDDNHNASNDNVIENDNSQIILDDTTIPLLDTTNVSNDINDNDTNIIPNDDTHVLNDIDTNTHTIINTSTDTTPDIKPSISEQSKHKKKKKSKESDYIGLDGSYWSFTDTKRESVRRATAYDLTLQKESAKRKREFSSYEYEKERKKRRLAAQERLLKYGPRKPSQRSIEEKQRLMQQRLATMELNALEVIGAEVVPGLYVGSKYAARNLEWIKAAGVNYVVNCTPSTACNVAPGVVYHNISINDSPSEKDVLKKIIGNEVNYIGTVLSDPSNKVLVHCNYGKSRSPTLVICYLIMALDWSLEDAYKKVDDCRKGISINIGFLQLIESIAEKARERRERRVAAITL